MKNIKLLKATGVLCLFFTIGHLSFPFMPDWNNSLEAMSSEIRYIFITIHYVTIALLAGMGFILTFQTQNLLKSPIASSVLVLFSSLFIVRIITEFILWRAPMPQALVILPLCMFPVVVFLRSILTKSQS